MHPFHPPRPSAAQSPHPRPGDPGRPPFLPAPMHQQMNPAAFQPPGPGGFGAANPMAAVAAAAANPFLAMQLFGQAQQLQNLAYLSAAFQQQQQQQQHHQQQPQQQPFFPGGFPPNPNQFGAFQGQAGFNGGGAFRPGGAGLRPPLPMMGAAGNVCNGAGVGPGGAGLPGSRPPLSMMSSAVGNGSPRPGLNVDAKDRNIDGRGSQVNHPNNKSDGISHVISENGGRNNTTDQKTRFNPGTDGRGGKQFGPSGGRGRGDGRGGKQFGPSGGRGRGDARDGRQFGPSGGRGRGRNFNQGRGRGRNDWREGKPNFTNNDSPKSGGRHIDSPSASEGGRKRPPIIYDPNEVKQWVHARKKNYPTSVNINKKLSRSRLDDQKKDEEAQMRRRELKKVVAKQKELGLELCELPPGYLSETEGQPKEPQGNGKESKWKTQDRDSRFGNRGRGRGNKRPRNNDRRDFQSKRPREWNPSHAMVEIREPTLLQKLISSDIKRDRHRLLHTFKFMAQNNFFKDWPDKPLEFPSVKVNQIELDFDIDPEDLDDDDLPDAETAKGGSLDLKENSDQQDLGSSDEEAGSKDGDEADEDEDDDEVADEDADSDEEQCDASEEFSA
ncbi:unnamed protein product [Alopecurus aequalis]